MANPAGEGFESYDDIDCSNQYHRVAGLWNLSRSVASYHLQRHHVCTQFAPGLF